MLFAEDTILVDKIKGLGRKLVNWRETLERNGIKISCTRIEYLVVTLTLKHERDLIQ